jgi:hypothetical protein
VCRAEGLPVPHALVMHMAHHHHAQPVNDDRAEWSQRWQYEQVNTIRVEQGLARLPVGPASVSVALAERAAAALVVMTEEFDGWPGPPPSVVHVGPIAEEVEVAEWDSPWAADDRRPLIVISMSTMYMHQEEVLRRVAASIANMNARVLVLTGSELEPGEVAWPPGVQVRRYVPHHQVLPGATRWPMPTWPRRSEPRCRFRPTPGLPISTGTSRQPSLPDHLEPERSGWRFASVVTGPAPTAIEVLERLGSRGQKELSQRQPRETLVPLRETAWGEA